MQPSFIHLRLHTEYSLSDGLVRIEELVEGAVRLGMPAIAITDQSNLFATVKFYQAAIAAGIKPIIGADCWLENSQNVKQPFRITFLCQNDQGYKNLIQLVSRSYLEGQQLNVPIIKKAWLAELADGLIVLNGGCDSDIRQAFLAGKIDQAALLLQEWLALFPNRVYLELQRTGRVQEEEYIAVAIDLAQRYNAPVVATNDVRFVSRDDFEAHEARVCIHGGYVLNDSRRTRIYSECQYLRSQQEMQQLFADIPEALINSVEIAKRCSLKLELGKSFLPNFPIPGGMTPESYLTQQAEIGLTERLRVLQDSEIEINKYHERLRIELDVINPMGFAGYFLIVADFIRWAKENKIPVGPGRGSGAGSLVAYVLQITDLDPLQYDLLFERFLNPERVSMPDFDIDFCMDGRDRVIDYVTAKYGRHAVSQIITYGSMAARAVVRDVGRVLGYPYGMVDKIAKLIPFELGITLDKALEQEDELKRRYEQEDEVRVLFDLAQKLEGLARNAGKHAGGVVIAPSKLTDFTALYCESGSEHCVTQFDKDDIEAVGLVKFDFLGLRTLTIIDWAVQTINKIREVNGEALLDISHISLNDPQTYALLKACNTTAVFQLESRGMRDLVKRLQPDCLEDIIALVALFRPGPLQSGMVDDFINRKHGRARADYFHPWLEPILRPTYGIILYQEQVMQIAQVLAGYTLGAADLLRRAMGKKKPEEMAKQRATFISGASEKGVKQELADHIFDLMEKFAGYGFNKSHSAAYALVSYQTAWLKAHYPAEFMAAVLSSDMDHTEKVVGFLEDCRALHLKVLPPDINRCQYKFTVSEQGEIVYGLGAIKGAGEAALETIIEVRESGGRFKDLYDFCQRIDTRKVNRRVLEALLRSGSLDELGPNRASLMNALEPALHMAEQHAETRERGQHDLFGATASAVTNFAPMPEIADWVLDEKLKGEKETLGFYLSGHPLQNYEHELKHFITAPLAGINHNKNQNAMIAGWVIGMRTLFTKKGDRMAIITLEDCTGRLDLTVFSDAFNTYKDLLNKDQLLIVEGEVSLDDYTGNSKVLVRKAFNITQARERFARCLVFKIAKEDVSSVLMEQLQQTIKPYCPGSCPIVIEYHHLDAKAHLTLGEGWRVRPSDELLRASRMVLGDEAVVFAYHTS